MVEETGLQAVLWDMDGTLIDSEPVWIRAQGSMVRQAGGNWTQEDGLALVGADMPDTVAAMQAAGVELPDSQIVEQLVSQVMKELSDAVPWRPGVLELLVALREAGLPQGIVTTSPRPMAAIVADASPAGTFEFVVSGDDVNRDKPHPEPYLNAASRLGVEPVNCVAIEDSPTGLASAVAAGVVPIGVPNDADLGEPAGWHLLTGLAGITVADLERIVQRHHA